MDAFELYNENQKPTGIWACGKCRKLTLGDNSLANTHEAAEKCCRLPACDICGITIESAYRSLCAVCQRNKDQRDRHELNEKRLANAVDITDVYEGPVFLENFGNGDMGGDGFYTSVNAIIDYASDEDELLPEWAFACSSETRGIELYSILEDICSDGYEEMGEHFTIPDSLKTGIEQFNLINKNELTVYNVDYSRKVKIQ